MARSVRGLTIPELLLQECQHLKGGLAACQIDSRLANLTGARRRHILYAGKGKYRHKETGMPVGPQGQKRPKDQIACSVMVAKIATGEIEETTQPPTERKAPSTQMN